MSAPRRILVLDAGIDPPEDVAALVKSLEAVGAAVAVRKRQDDSDALLDAIAEADCVVCLK